MFVLNNEFVVNSAENLTSQGNNIPLVKQLGYNVYEKCKDDNIDVINNTPNTNLIGIGIIKRDVYDTVYLNYSIRSLGSHYNVYSLTFESPSGVIYKTPYMCKNSGVFDFASKRFVVPNSWSISKVGLNINCEYCKCINIDIKPINKFDSNANAMIQFSYNAFINGMLLV